MIKYVDNVNSTLWIFPSLLLLRSESKQSSFSPLLPSNLYNQKPHKITQSPVTAMCTQHVEVLDIQRSATTGKAIVNLAVIIEQKHSFFSDFFARKVVSLKLHIRWEFGNCCGASGDCGGQECWWGRAPAEHATEGLPESGCGARDIAHSEGIGEFWVYCCINAVCDCC